MAVESRPAADIGYDGYVAPETEDTGVLHFASGAGFTRVAAQFDRPDGSGIESPWPAFEGETIVITRRQATAATQVD